MSALRLGLPLACLSLLSVPGSAFLPLGPANAITANKPLISNGQSDAAWRVPRTEVVSWSSKKGGGKSKKEAPPKTVVKHLDEDEVQFILMLDSKASANINTTAETLVTRGSAQYVVGLPVNTPIIVVDGEMVALDMEEDGAKLKELIPAVDKALTESGSKLLKSAGTLTIEGEFEFYDDFEDEGEFGGDVEEEGEEEAGDEPMPFQNMVDPDFADRMGASPSVTEGDFDFDDRDDSYLDDEEAYMEEMTEELTKFEHEGEGYTIRKFVQPFYLCAKRNGDSWELLKGEAADQVLDWVLQDQLENEFLLLEDENR